VPVKDHRRIGAGFDQAVLVRTSSYTTRSVILYRKVRVK
jgi:hypothetical protein